MKKIIAAVAIASLAASHFLLQTRAQSPIAPIRKEIKEDIIQFNNLVIQSVSGTSAPAEIVAISHRYLPQSLKTKETITSEAKETSTPSVQSDARGETATLCRKFESLESISGMAIACPEPIPQPQPTPTPTPPRYPVGSYRITVDARTILLLRDRSYATLSDFEAGNRINVFGFYNEDGTIRGLIVRNLSKPPERRFIQLNNVEVAAIEETDPLSFIVIRRNDPCYIFIGERKSEFPCPPGLKLTPQVEQLIPERIKPELEAVRKYEVKLTARTIVLDRNRNTIPASSISLSDKLNIYGFTTDEEGRSITAEIVRDLSKPTKLPAYETYLGTVTQINADGSFLIRTEAGQTFTVQDPIKVGAIVKIRGILDELSQIISGVTELSVRTKEKEIDAEVKSPRILSISPSSGPVGTKVTLTGVGFTAQGNSINFAGVRNAVLDVQSPDGRTLSFTIPATPCSPGTFCAQVVLQDGTYPLSVTNSNGTSNEVKFTVDQIRY